MRTDIVKHQMVSGTSLFLMLKCDGQVVNLSLPRLLVSLSFGHIARLHGSADVKVIPTAFPPED